MADQVVHQFDEQHAEFAAERQGMYPPHSMCQRATYDWAKGVVCGCGTPLIGSNPPVGGKGEQMKNDGWKEQFIHDLDSGGTCRVPWCPSTSDNGKDHREYSVSWVGPPQEAEPIKMGPGHIMVPGLDVEIPDTDAEHELAAGVTWIEEQVSLILPIRALPSTNACNYIFGDEIQPSRLIEWAMLFIKKQKDYGDGADDLGQAGQYAELHRKITKLRRAMWEGIPLENEPVREVLMDLIGHCFLAMMYTDRPRFQRYPKGNPNK
jgi:hypothetical protein